MGQVLTTPLPPFHTRNSLLSLHLHLQKMLWCIDYGPKLVRKHLVQVNTFHTKNRINLIFLP
jgi:hypothetical protein